MKLYLFSFYLSLSLLTSLAVYTYALPEDEAPIGCFECFRPPFLLSGKGKILSKNKPSNLNTEKFCTSSCFKFKRISNNNFFSCFKECSIRSKINTSPSGNNKLAAFMNKKCKKTAEEIKKPIEKEFDPKMYRNRVVPAIKIAVIGDGIKFDDPHFRSYFQSKYAMESESVIENSLQLIQDCEFNPSTSEYCLREYLKNENSYPSQNPSDGAIAAGIILPYQHENLINKDTNSGHFFFYDLRPKSYVLGDITAAIFAAHKHRVDLIYFSLHERYSGLIDRALSLISQEFLKSPTKEILVVAPLHNTDTKDFTSKTEVSLNSLTHVFRAMPFQTPPHSFFVTVCLDNEDLFFGSHISRRVAFIEERFFFYLRFLSDKNRNDLEQNKHALSQDHVALLFCNSIKICKELFQLVQSQKIQLIFLISKEPIDFRNMFYDVTTPVVQVPSAFYEDISNLATQSNSLKVVLKPKFNSGSPLYPSPRNLIAPERLFYTTPNFATPSLPNLNKNGYPEGSLNVLQRSTLIASARMAAMLALYLSRVKYKILQESADLNLLTSSNIKTRLQNTATPFVYKEVMPGLSKLAAHQGWAAPAFEQGAGFMNLENALSSQVTIQPSTIALGSTASDTVELTLTNNSENDEVYNLNVLHALAIKTPRESEGVFKRRPITLDLTFGLRTLNCKLNIFSKSSSLTIKIKQRSSTKICAYFKFDRTKVETKENSNYYLSGYLKFNSLSSENSPLFVSYLKKIELDIKKKNPE